MSKETTWTDEDYSLDGVSNEPPPPPPNGLYKAQIIEAEYAESQKDKKKMCKLVLKITGSHDGSELPSCTKTLYGVIMFDKDSRWKVKQLVDATQCAPPSKVNEDEIGEFSDRLLDSPEILIATRLSPGQNGRMRAEIAGYHTEETGAAYLAGSSEVASVGGGRRRRAG